MKRLIWGALALSLLASPLAAWADPPEPRIIKRFAGTQINRGGGSPIDVYEPAYLPIRLLETPYASWPIAAQQQVPVGYYNEFWQYHQSLTERGATTECLPPVLSDYPGATIESMPTGSITAVALAKGAPVAVVGKQTFEEPVWDIAAHRIATLKFLKVESVIKNSSATPIAVDDVLSFLVTYGTATIAGQSFCSRAEQPLSAGPADGPPIVEAKRFFVTGLLPAYQQNHLLASEASIFRVIDGTLYPPPGVPALSSTPLTLSQLISGLAEN